jgi:hypothetical protein
MDELYDPTGGAKKYFWTAHRFDVAASKENVVLTVLVSAGFVTSRK